MILVVDDCPRRVSGFSLAFGNTYATHTCEAALAALRDPPYQFATLYLDHDGVDGLKIAETMAREKLHTGAKVVIHSSNYAGAIAMRDALQATHDVELLSFEEICGDALEGGKDGE